MKNKAKKVEMEVTAADRIRRSGILIITLLLISLTKGINVNNQPYTQKQALKLGNGVNPHIVWGMFGFKKVAFVAYQDGSNIRVSCINSEANPVTRTSMSVSGTLRSLGFNLLSGEPYYLVSFRSGSSDRVSLYECNSTGGSIHVEYHINANDLNVPISGCVGIKAYMDSYLTFSDQTGRVGIYHYPSNGFVFERSIMLKVNTGTSTIDAQGVLEGKSNLDLSLIFKVRTAQGYFLCTYTITSNRQTITVKACIPAKLNGWSFKWVNDNTVFVQDEDKVALYQFSSTSAKLHMETTLDFAQAPNGVASPVAYHGITSSPLDKDGALVAFDKYVAHVKVSSGIIEYTFPTGVAGTLVGVGDIETHFDPSTNLAMAIYEVKNGGTNEIWMFQLKKGAMTCHGSCGGSCLAPAANQCLNCGGSNKLHLTEPYTGAGTCTTSACSQFSYLNSVCYGCLGLCKTCSGDAFTCTSCEPPLVLYQSECVASCPVGYYINSNNACIACPGSNCDVCDPASPATCTTCSDTFFLETPSCLAQCSAGRVQTPTNELCELCDTGCASCLSVPNNCDVCKLGYFIDGTSCPQCDANCRSCSGTAISCDTCVAPADGVLNYYAADQKKCFEECPFGYFNIGYNCFPCNSPCETCSGNANQCLTCVGDKVLYQSTCLDLCPVDTYFEDQECFDCSSPCSTCQGSSTTCLSCESSLNLFEANCQSNCPSGFFSSNFVCLPCKSPCATCSGTSDNCLSCEPPKSLFEGKCYDGCPPGSYQSGSNCLACTSPCSTCTSATECLTCVGVKKLYGTDCLDSCPSGTFTSGTECFDCSSPCQTCSGSADNCLTCEGSQLVFEGNCYEECPSGLFQSGIECRTCSSPCTTCVDFSTKCLSCEGSKKLYLNNCYDNCPFGTIAIGTECVPCSAPCQTCSTSPEKCLTCLGTMKLYQGICFDDCPKKTTVLTSSPFKCSDCHESCLACEASTEVCTECGFEMKLNPEGKCEKVTCPFGTYVDGNLECSPCSEECNGCQFQAGNCLECSENYELFSPGVCHLVRSGRDYWIPPNNCHECSKNCDKCDPNPITRKPDCQIFIDITPRIGKKGDTKVRYDLVLDLMVYSLNKKKVDCLNLIEREILQNNFEFSLTELSELSELQVDGVVFWNEQYELRAGLTFKEDFNRDKSYTLQIKLLEGILFKKQTGDPGSLYIVQEEYRNKELEFTPGEKITEEQIEAAKSTGAAAGNSLSYTSGPTEYMSVMGFAFSADQSGSMIKFTQISKLISRLRLIGIEFGELFTAFIDGVSNAFDKGDKNKLEIFEKGNGTKGKLSFYGVSLFLIRPGEDSLMANVKIFVYFLSWILKIISWEMLANFKRTRVITEKKAKFVQIHRKVHFAIFNINTIPFYFYGIRTVLHTKKAREFILEYVLSVLGVFLISYDIMDLAWICLNIGKDPDKSKEGLEKQKEPSKFEFEEHELNVDDNFRRMRKGSLGLRSFFVEEEMVKNVMSKEQAKRIGYVRLIDYHGTIDKIVKDQVIEDFAISHLNKNYKIFLSMTILMDNFFNLMKSVLYHVVLVSLPYNPGFQLILLTATETSYLFNVVKNYIKYKHLRYFHMFLSKILQSVALIAFHLLCVIILIWYKSKPVPLKIQRAGMYVIIATIVLELIFLVWNLVFIVIALVVGFLEERKRKKNGGGGKEEKEEKTVIRYLWVRKVILEKGKKLDLGKLDRKRKNKGKTNLDSPKEKKFQRSKSPKGESRKEPLVEYQKLEEIAKVGKAAEISFNKPSKFQLDRKKSGERSLNKKDEVEGKKHKRRVNDGRGGRKNKILAQKRHQARRNIRESRLSKD